MRLFLSFILLFSWFCSSAQNADSVVVLNARWNKVKVCKGVDLLSYHFRDSSLFNSNQYVSILKINPKFLNKKNGYKLAVVASDTLVKTSVFADNYKAIAGINGSYFAFGKPFNSVDYLRVNGVNLAPNEYNGGRRRLFHQGGALVINNGILEIQKPVGDSLSILNWEDNIIANDIMVSGPLLLFDGQDIEGNSTSHYKSRHPRSVVSIMKDGSIFLIAIDGRAKESSGMDLDQVRSFFKWMGAVSILNLDGGGSTALYVNNIGIVNHPTDNKTFDNNGERKVANAVLLIK